jgi:hypothetical protein
VAKLVLSHPKDNIVVVVVVSILFFLLAKLKIKKLKTKQFCRFSIAKVRKIKIKIKIAGTSIVFLKEKCVPKTIEG